MTVKDILNSSVDYQDFEYKICDFGNEKKLWEGTSAEYEELVFNDEDIPYANCTVAAIKFGTGWIKLILNMNQ